MSWISNKIKPIIFLILPPSYVVIIGLLVMAGLLYRPDNSVGKDEIEFIVAIYLIPPIVVGYAGLIFGIYPVFIKTEKLFQSYTNVVFEYQFLKKFLFIIIIALVGMNILSIILFLHVSYSFYEFDSYMFDRSLAALNLVTLGGILRFVTQVGKKEFRFYFAKACCKIMAEKEEYSEKLRYMRLLLESYNKYLHRKLRVTISDLSGIYSILLFKDGNELNQIINKICNSLDGDKLSLAKYLSSLCKVPDSKFYSEESFFQQLKLPGTIVVTAVPIIISIIQVVK